VLLAALASAAFPSAADHSRTWQALQDTHAPDKRPLPAFNSLMSCLLMIISRSSKQLLRACSR